MRLDIEESKACEPPLPPLMVYFGDQLTRTEPGEPTDVLAVRFGMKGLNLRGGVLVNKAGLVRRMCMPGTRAAEEAAIGFLKALQAGDAEAPLWKKIGALTRKCVFCDIPLKDTKSVEEGVGPHCKEKYLKERPAGDVLNATRMPKAAAALLRRPVGRDVNTATTTARQQHGAAPPPRVAITPENVLTVLKAHDRHAEGPIATLCEILNDAPEPVFHALMGPVKAGDVADARLACEDVAFMLKTGLAPAYDCEGGLVRLLRAALLADLIGDIARLPIARWLKLRWQEEPFSDDPIPDAPWYPEVIADDDEEDPPDDPEDDEEDDPTEDDDADE
jgi:hypothetical protein